MSKEIDENIADAVSFKEGIQHSNNSQDLEDIDISSVLKNATNGEIKDTDYRIFKQIFHDRNNLSSLFSNISSDAKHTLISNFINLETNSSKNNGTKSEFLPMVML